MCSGRTKWTHAVQEQQGKRAGKSLVLFTLVDARIRAPGLNCQSATAYRPIVEDWLAGWPNQRRQHLRAQPGAAAFYYTLLLKCGATGRLEEG